MNCTDAAEEQKVKRKKILSPELDVSDTQLMSQQCPVHRETPLTICGAAATSLQVVFQAQVFALFFLPEHVFRELGSLEIRERLARILPSGVTGIFPPHVLVL